MRKLKGGELYQRLGIETQVVGASPHQLIGLLYANAIAQLNQGIICHERQEHAKCRQAISKALGLIGGLSDALNFEVSSEIPYNLQKLYRYMQEKLIESGRQFSVNDCKEIVALLETLSEGWAGISP